jgi:hypothetical protein
MSVSRSKSSPTVPKALQQAYVQNLDDARTTASTLGEMGSRQYADFTPDFYAGADALRNFQSGPGYSNLSGAVKNLRGMTSYAAPTINRSSVRDINAPTMNRGDIRDVNASAINREDIRDADGGSFLNMNLNQYMNPYLNLVGGNMMTDLNRAREMQLGQDAFAAQQAGAFGGSRHGIAGAETNRNYYDQLSRNLNNLYAQGYDAATGLAGQDLTRGLQASMSNQGMDYNVQTANQRAALESQFANQGMDYNVLYGNAMSNLEAQLANQGVDVSVLNANQRAELEAQAMRMAAAQAQAAAAQSQAQMDFQQSQALMNLGLTQQGLDQSRLDADRDLLLQQQEIRNAAAGLYPGVGSSSSSSGFSLLS